MRKNRLFWSCYPSLSLWSSTLQMHVDAPKIVLPHQEKGTQLCTPEPVLTTQTKNLHFLLQHHFQSSNQDRNPSMSSKPVIRARSGSGSMKPRARGDMGQQAISMSISPVWSSSVVFSRGTLSMAELFSILTGPVTGTAAISSSFTALPVAAAACGCTCATGDEPAMVAAFLPSMLAGITVTGSSFAGRRWRLAVAVAVAASAPEVRAQGKSWADTAVDGIASCRLEETLLERPVPVVLMARSDLPGSCAAMTDQPF